MNFISGYDILAGGRQDGVIDITAPPGTVQHAIEDNGQPGVITQDEWIKRQYAGETNIPSPFHFRAVCGEVVQLPHWLMSDEFIPTQDKTCTKCLTLTTN